MQSHQINVLFNHRCSLLTADCNWKWQVDASHQEQEIILVHTVLFKSFEPALISLCFAMKMDAVVYWNMFKNTWSHFHELSWWYYMVYKYLNFDKLPTDWNAVPDHESQMFFADSARFLLLDLFLNLLCTYWWQFESKISNFFVFDFQFSSCVIWHISLFSPCYPSLRMASWQPAFAWEHLWLGLH